MSGQGFFAGTLTVPADAITIASAIVRAIHGATVSTTSSDEIGFQVEAPELTGSLAEALIALARLGAQGVVSTVGGVAVVVSDGKITTMERQKVYVNGVPLAKTPITTEHGQGART